MARPRKVHVLIALAVFIVLLAAGVVVMVSLIRGPLAGPTRHDFGDVPIDAASAEVQHTFRLVNRGDVPLALVNIKRSCNCASAVAIPDVVDPGGTLDVTVTLRLSDKAPKQSRITLVMEHGEGQLMRNLFVMGRGVRE